MNCKDFEDVVIGLAGDRMDDRMMNAAEREEGLAHAESCRRCAACLADERVLAAGLAELAADDRDRVAPARVEAALLAAFRQSVKQSVKTMPPLTEPVHTRSRYRFNTPLYWGAAVAALVLIALGLIASIALRSGALRSESPRLHSNRSSAGERPLPSTPAPVANSEHSGAEGRAVASDPPPRSKWSRENREKKKRYQMAAAGRGAERISRVTLVPDEMTVYAADSGEAGEVATDFLPLSSISYAASVERGLWVRVQMPRSALVSFGLPMNAEQAQIPITADLLVGEDGVTHAIRFVH